MAKLPRPTCHLDRGYDSTVTLQLLDELGSDGQITRKGVLSLSRCRRAGPRYSARR